jgi:(E)-4-hydroxy-3-methylbut-2-enyl-diphosphate synthase
MIKRRASRPVSIGGVTVGGGAPVVVQSMTNTDTRNAAATIDQVRGLEEAGCEIVRVAVPDQQAAAAIVDIKKGISIPLVADIHFDYRLALAALHSGADGLRINPGNIGDADRVKQVVLAARERAVPIRIGLNAGSLPKTQYRSGSVASRMVNAALAYVRQMEALDFDLIKISLKAFDVPTTIEAYRAIAEQVPYPLHVGITEAGTPRTGIIRSAVGIGSLLWLGIGDTIRVSLTAPPVEEVTVAWEILKSLDLRARGPVLVSCPSCGRSEADVIHLALAVEERLSKLTKPVRVAVMGCVVNGPGEAKDADVGIACGKGRGVIFKRGVKLRTVDEADYLEALMKEVESL